VTAPFGALAAVAGAMQVISRTTGSGWLVVVVSCLLGLLALSAVLPTVALVGLDVGVRGPFDATAGRPVTLAVTVGGRPHGVLLRLAAPAGEWVRIDGPGSGPVAAVPARRGVLGHVAVEVRSAGPFGLVWWGRRWHVPLERPMEVGPDPMDVSAPSPAQAATDAAADPARASVLSPELPRGVRDYVAGDPPRLVSWPATARHGRLMVKELEGEAASLRLTLVVDLRSGGEAAEQVASRAAGMAIDALRQGMDVSLATAEAGAPRLGPVTTPVDIGRRLARATGDGPPADPPAGAGGEVVRVPGG
jgi:uncharacterized protein (DUF58 family)